MTPPPCFTVAGVVLFLCHTDPQPFKLWPKSSTLVSSGHLGSFVFGITLFVLTCQHTCLQTSNQTKWHKSGVDYNPICIGERIPTSIATAARPPNLCSQHVIRDNVKELTLVEKLDGATRWDPIWLDHTYCTWLSKLNINDCHRKRCHFFFFLSLTITRTINHPFSFPSVIRASLLRSRRNFILHPNPKWIHTSCGVHAVSALVNPAFWEGRL